MSFLGCVFADRSEFEFDPVRFELAYAELERALYDGHTVTVVIAPLLGIALDPDTRELALGDGLSLVRGDTLADARPTRSGWRDRGTARVGDAEHQPGADRCSRRCHSRERASDGC